MQGAIVLKQKLFICFVLFCAMCVVVDNYYYLNIVTRDVTKVKNTSLEIACYYEPSLTTSVPSLKEEELSDPSKTNNNIYFLETSCSEDGRTSLTPRQACAVESAARMNSNMTIYLFILSPHNFSDSAKNLVDRLSTYFNIIIRRIFVKDYVKNTALEQWWASEVFKTSWWPKQHMSDVLRFLTLWKFPGMYFDLDVVVTSSVADLGEFLVAEDNEVVNAAVMGLGRSQISRQILKMYLEGIRNDFEGSVWRHNGPDLVTDIMIKICGTSNTSEMTRDRCSGFTVHPPSMFYPIHYKYWRRYFERDVNNKTMRLIRKSRAVHVWNKLSNSRSIRVGELVPYAILASQYCPRVYQHCGKVF